MTQVISPEIDAREKQSPDRQAGSQLLRLVMSNEFGLAVLILVAFSAFAVALPGFTSPFSLFTIGRQIGIDTMIGLAMMAVIVTGGLDLSVGAIGVCAAMLFGYAAQVLGLPLFLAVPAAILFGALLGAINGYAVVRTGVHSFIITLASMSIFFGVMIFLSKAQAFNALPPEVTAMGKMRLFGKVSVLLFVTLFVCAVLVVFYRFTTLGRQMLAAGANRARRRTFGHTHGPRHHCLPRFGGRSRRLGRVDADRPDRCGGSFDGRPSGSGLAPARLPRPGSGRHTSVWRTGVGCRHASWRGIRHHHDERAASHARR